MDVPLLSPNSNSTTTITTTAATQVKPSPPENVCDNATEKEEEVTLTTTMKRRLLLFLVIKWVLKILMWSIFIPWVALCFFFPSKFVQGHILDPVIFNSGIPFGLSGSFFLLFSVPLLIIAFLAIAYVNVLASFTTTQDYIFYDYKKRKTNFTGFRLWTFPIIVDGPFGVVSAAELIGILLFALYIIWATSAFTILNLSVFSTFSLKFNVRSSFILELSALRFGTIGLFCLVFLFLPVARGSFLLRLIDIPFEHATRYHVWLGHLTMLMFTLHGLFYVWAWTMDGRLLHKMLEWPNAGFANLPGVISLSAGLMMWVTSLHPVRKKYFELFFYTHQLYVVFAVFLALHVGDFIFSTAAAGMFLFLLDRFLRFCQSRNTVKLVSATCLPCGTLELVLAKPRNLRYNALSFVFLQVRELSLLQWHPFSVSSSPLDGRHHISVLVKVLGEWTKKLGDRILSTPQEPMKEMPLLTHSRITASVEGPYGHESSYHLMYRNLILVAGGIGVSPFLAVLRDILHHIAQRKPCMPEKVLIVWAVKTSKELSLLFSFDVQSICPSYSDKLYLEIQTYVTRESDPPLVNENGIVCKGMNSNYFPIASNSGICGLVGTGNNIWSGIYVIFSTIGFIILLAIVDLLYVKPFGISSGWFRGLLFVICMIGSVVTFGALVVVLWYLWERRDSSYEKCIGNDCKSGDMQPDELRMHTAAVTTTLGSLSTVQYGCRPNFRDIFCSVSNEWGHVDVGVIVCGPSTLQSSVAKECRSQNSRGRKKEAFFHFNSHSFDL